jgi:hypothetical protein
MLASAELREQNRESHVRTPIDAKRLADFLAKIEAYEAVLLQRQRDIENQIVVYHIEQKSADRHIKVDVATAEHLVEKKRARGKTTTRYPDDPEMRDVYEEELRRLRLRAVLLDEAQHLITSGDGKQSKDQLNWIKSTGWNRKVIGCSSRKRSNWCLIALSE